MNGSGSGWIVYSWIMLIVAGTFAIIDGIVAISRASFFHDYGAHYVASSLSTWGWLQLIVGIVAVAAAFGVMSGRQWGRWTGIVIAALQLFVQIFWIPIVPFWALTIIVLDILVIYGLSVYAAPSEA